MSDMSLIELSPILKDIYTEYSSKLNKGYHLNSDLEDTLNLYRDIYGPNIINKSFSELIFHFHAITNSFDDIIDRIRLENRKNTSIDSIIIFSSFFIVFQKIFYFLAESKEIIIPESILNSFFSIIFKNVKKICEAPLKELEPPQLSKDYPVEKIIIDVMYNRCYAYVFLGNLCDSLLKIKNIDIKEITSTLVLYKIVEMLNRDLNTWEIEKDIKNNTFNIVLYLQDKLNIKEEKEIQSVLYNVLDTVKLEFNKALHKLELPEICQISQKFNEKISFLNKKLGGSIYLGKKGLSEIY